MADIVGQPGFDILTRLLPSLINQRRPDLVIVNGENGSEGKGLTVELTRTLLEMGVDVITSGNHIWDKQPLRKELKNLPQLLRPLNYPAGSGGHGSIVVKTKSDMPVAVVNLQGRTYMTPIDCPFRTAEREIKNLAAQTRIVFVDMHAESTAEKQAFAWFLDGQASVIVGTHTHVQTADERILPGGTGYITDAGMTGAFDSVIGSSIKVSIQKFLTQTPQPFHLASENIRLNGVVADIDPATGKCLRIERLNLP
ncbi:MAG: TIGR00282 family metallophosphoesterase [Calditrichota bacterium]